MKPGTNLLPQRFRSQGVAIAHDLIVVPIAWYLAFWLRYNLGAFPPGIDKVIFNTLLVVLPVQATIFMIFGLYRGIWRFASLPDIVRIIKAVAVGGVASLAVLFLLVRAEGLPRSVPIIYSLLLILMLSGSRLLYRWIKDRNIYLPSGERVLIVGAGLAGEMLARDLLRNQREAYRPVAFVDDNLRRKGRDIHGIPIVGNIEEIPAVIDRLDIDVIMIAIPSAKSQQIRRVVERCETAGVPFRSVPHLQDLMSGNVKINELREVSIEDLLGREAVSLDWEGIRQAIAGKTILVTGGGGSIGSELCRQLAKMEPDCIVVLDHSEFNLYSIQMELLESYPDLCLVCSLGDVTDRVFIDTVFGRHQPDVVFHAAAYKHVPLLESQIRQAIRNNVIGTRILAEAADAAGCGVFVLVSTDKAVNPANIMGMTKRVAELTCQNLNEHSTTLYITVRFGNVLDSAGSVIPLFRKQIAAGGPVTVTDPRMERYFMTIPEACQLIMQTLVMGEGGEIFVLDMGAAVRIRYLAEQMILLSGKVPDEDIKIEYIGLRPGEKLFEELFHEKEALQPTTHKKLFLAKFRRVEWDWLNQVLDEMVTGCGRMDDSFLLERLRKLVPEYLEQCTDEVATPGPSRPGAKGIVADELEPG